MKIGELKENGLYACNDEKLKANIYSVRDGRLYFCPKGHNTLIESVLYYNTALNLDFVKYYPEIDWSKVAVDEEIYVYGFCAEAWFKRHFAAYENGKVLTWVNGKTSFTSAGETETWESENCLLNKEISNVSCKSKGKEVKSVDNL